MIRLSSFLAASMLGALPAWSGELVYTPINPSFGGSPLNSAHLLGTANAQRSATARDFEDPLDTDDVAEEPRTGVDVDLFIRQLQSRLFSSLAGQVNDAIFGDDPQDAGTITFGSTTVDFNRTPEEITLVITDTLDGTVTEVTVPQLVASQ